MHAGMRGDGRLGKDKGGRLPICRILLFVLLLSGLEENQALLRLAEISRPYLVFLECVAGVEQRQLWGCWGRLQSAG